MPHIGPRGPKPTEADADARIGARLAEPEQHLTKADKFGMEWLPGAGAIYAQTDERSARCPHCLRAFDPYGASNRRSTYCSETCRWALADERRFERPGEWLRCEECGIDSLAFDTRRVLCAPPWPARYCDPSPCAAAHKKRLDSRATVAYRERQDALLAAA